jgi:hypothetical protein
LNPIAQELQNLMLRGKVIPFVGAGVSQAVAAAPGWWKLLDQGLRYAEDRGLASVAALKSARTLLANNDLTAAADELETILGAPDGEFPAWLTQTFGFGISDLRDPGVLQAIQDLLAPFVVTTNYDRLLSIVFPGSWTTATWDQPVSMLTKMREGQAILHLHGIYDMPKSVIFGARGYNRLVRRKAYRELMRLLWLQNTLVFIGCSADGLQDPDFSRLFRWATTAFKGSPYKHYWLTLRGATPFDEKVRWLLGKRVQVLEYGSSYGDLPGFLAQLCPDRERAVEERVRLVQLAVGTDNADVVLSKVQSLRTLVPLLGATPAPLPAKLEVGPGPSDLRHLRNARLRLELADCQKLARELVSVNDLRECANIGAATGPFFEETELPSNIGDRKVYHRHLREVAKSASAAVFLFTDELLGALNRRGVRIHPAVLSGFAREIIELSSFSFDKFGLDDSYTQENMYRVIDDLMQILEADGSQLFTDLPPAATLEHPVDEALLISRTGKLQLISVSSEHEVVAELPILPTFRCGVQVVESEATIIVGHTEESLFIWNPYARKGISQELIIKDPIGISHAAHCICGGELISAMQTFDGRVLCARNLKGVEVAWNRRNEPLSDPVVFPDGRIFALQEGDAVVEILPNAQLKPVISERAMVKHIEEHPDSEPLGEARLTGMSLRVVRLAGRTALALMTQVEANLIEPRGSAILFISPGRKNRVTGSVVLRNGIPMDYSLAHGPDGRARLWVCLLNLDYAQCLTRRCETEA